MIDFMLMIFSILFTLSNVNSSGSFLKGFLHEAMTDSYHIIK